MKRKLIRLYDYLWKLFHSNQGRTINLKPKNSGLGHRRKY